MKKKFLFGLGALAIFVMLQINVNLVENSQKSDLTLGSMVELAQADDEFDPCPVNPIPQHCGMNPDTFKCSQTIKCWITCIGGC